MFIKNREYDIAIAHRSKDELVAQRQVFVEKREEIQKQLDEVDKQIETFNERIQQSDEVINELENSSEVPILMFHIDESEYYTSRTWPYGIEYHIDAYKTDIYYLPELDRLFTKRYIPKKHKDYYQKNQACTKKSGIELLPNTIDMRKYFSEFGLPGHKEYDEPSSTDINSVYFYEIYFALEAISDKIKEIIEGYGIQTAQDFRDVVYELMEKGEFDHLGDDYCMKIKEGESQESNIAID